MIDGLKPYPKYKDSGVPWLGEVPEHWEVVRNGRLFAERREVGFPELPVLEVSLRTGVRVRNGDSGARKQALGDLSAYKRARAGDIAYNMMRMWQGAVGIAPVDGLVSPAYVVARPFREADSGYYEYLFRTPAYMGEVNNYSRGIVADRNRLYWDEFKDVRSPAPPYDEQVLIVRFLRALDRRIGRYIRAKKKLIALLNEQKQAIIHRGVTRGLAPKVRLTASGVDWLGEIPAHWEVRKLQYLTDPSRPIMYGIVLPGPNVPEGVYLVKGGNCEPGRLRPELLCKTSFEIEASFRRSRLRAHDIVFAIRGGIGAAELVPPELDGANLTQDAARISPASGVVARWLLQVLRSPRFQDEVKKRKLGATISGINIRDLKRIDLAVPPLHEQEQILAHLASAIAPLEETLNRATSEVALVGEFRQRLIADVVTGKLDIREAAAHLSFNDSADEFVEIGDTDEALADDAEAEMEAVEVED